MEKTPIASLIRDETLYPRIQISESNIASIRRALKAGFEIPPVIADRKTKTLIDGWHRVRASEAEYGEDADISVEWRTYRDRSAMLEDAIALQNHGERLQSIDIARCVILAKGMGLQKERLALCLHVTEDWLESLERRKVAQGPDGAFPVKGTLAHFAVHQNNRRDAGGNPPPFPKNLVQANKRANGASWWFVLDQAINVLSTPGLVPLNHEKAIPRIERLRDLTEAALKKIESTA